MMSKNIVQKLNINSFADGLIKEWETYDYYVSDVYIHDLLQYFPYRPNYYQIAICVSGWLKGRIDGKEFIYKKNSLAAFVPSTVLEVIETSDDYRCRLVVFKRDFLLEQHANLNFLEKFKTLNNQGIPYMLMDEDHFKTIELIFIDIRKKMEDKNHFFRRGMVRSLVLMLIYELEHIYLIKTGVHQQINLTYGKEKLLADFQLLLKSNFRTKRQVSFYAGKLNISTKYLSEILNEMIGKTTKRVIGEKVLTEAKILLKSGKCNVSEVAAELNYQNIEEFSRFFKKYSGMSPTQYKKMN